MNEEINLYEYAYTKDQVIMLDPLGFFAIIDLLNEVIETQPRLFVPLVYADKTEEVKDADGNVLLVNTDWKEHTPNSFFMTAAQENGGVPGMTALALKCQQIVYALQSIHAKNVQSGVAKKITDLQEKDALQELS